MTAQHPDLDRAETRLLRRLTRLFRIERRGRLARCAPAAAHRLVERRGALIEAVIALERRRPRPAAHAAAVAEAAAALAREIERARPAAERRAAQLAAELYARQGRGIASGVRGHSGGRLLGSG